MSTPPPPPLWIFLKGDSKVISKGLSLSASFDLCNISEGFTDFIHMGGGGGILNGMAINSQLKIYKYIDKYK